MKKRTNEEKAQMINEACDLYNEAKILLKKANKLLHLCGIEICGGFEPDDVAEDESYRRNIHLYSGIKKMSELAGIDTYFLNDYIGDREDKSVCYLRHKGLVFLQRGQEKTSRTKTYKFR